MRKTELDRNTYFKIAVVAFVAVFLLVGGFWLLDRWEDKNGAYSEYEPDNNTIVYDGLEYAPRENIETFLVMGLDKFEGAINNDSYNNDQQADFIMLFVFDNDQKKCTAIHINRDTMVDVNVLGVAGNKIATVKEQIALSHTYGNGKEVSCRNTADSVSALLMDVKVMHYISLTMDAVSKFNDLVGGVEVEVLDDFSGIDDTLICGETVTLMGEHALNYVRSRHGLDDSTNSARMKRQQQYINRLYEKMTMKIAADEEFIVEASLQMADYIVSDRSVTQLQALAEKFEEYEFLGIKNIEGELKQGPEFMEFYPNEDNLRMIVMDLFYITVN